MVYNERVFNDFKIETYADGFVDVVSVNVK